MPPRLNILSGFRALSIQPRPLAQPCVAAQARRLLATDTTSNNASQIQDNNFNGVLRAKMEAFGQVPQEEPAPPAMSENEMALKQLQEAAYGLNTYDPEVHGHKFGVPALPIAPDMNHKRRYDTVVEQVTKLLMRDGKLAKAQRDMAMILNHLRSSPAPKINPAKPLIPGSPAPEQLPLDPVGYLTVAIDSVAPLIKIRKYAKLAGGGRALELPAPLHLRQRRRWAFGWILDVVNKKPSRGSGRGMFPTRVAEEIIAVVEGRSSVWEKRNEIHKKGTAVRANVFSSRMKGIKL
ncbi:ribosomal protein S7 domain-containing protein [Cercophora newfieldiana]|uniref:Small ribosomal subunit protein uS7m n=1 Tax=Cercophora newfieldiana TaxID=92897 RepID=A0AA40CKK1_9PEZI|nr:ribosomal protein S7 domain-containing protein [Cercophora newfieldiana]